AKPTEMSGKLVVVSKLTDVGLSAQASGAGTGSISGKADVPASRAGILVVAETSMGTNGISGIADTSGAYEILNVPSGTWTVKAYAKGSNYDPGTATLSGSQTVN